MLTLLQRMLGVLFVIGGMVGTWWLLFEVWDAPIGPGSSNFWLKAVVDFLRVRRAPTKHSDPPDSAR